MSNLKAFQDYLQLEKNYSRYTVKAYVDDIQRFKEFIAITFNQNDLETINYSQIRSWIVSLVDNKISNNSINRKMQSLKAFYKFLLKIKQIEINPLLKHKALKTAKTLQIPFSEKELDNVLNHTVYSDDFEGFRNKLIIDLFYTTGIRRSELIHLKIKDVNLSSKTIKVLGKRNKERIIPILEIIEIEIKKYLSERANLQEIIDFNYLFLSQNGVKLSESFVYRLINSYFSGVSEKVKKSPHILRHTFATQLLNHGANLNSVKELLGHSSLASTEIYTHNSLSELRKVYGNAHPRNQKDN